MGDYSNICELRGRAVMGKGCSLMPGLKYCGKLSGDRTAVGSNHHICTDTDVDTLVDPNLSGAGASQMVLQTAPSAGLGGIKIFIKGATAGSNRWTEVRYIYANSGVPNLSVWRINGMYDDAMTGLNPATAARQQQIMRTGNIEFAVHQPGRADFSGGGSHGNEITNSFSAKADGQVFDPTGSAVLLPYRVEFNITSSVFDNSNSALKILDTQYKVEVFSPIPGVARVVTTVVFTVFNQQTFDFLYMGLLPVYRNNGAIDIVTSGQRSGDGYPSFAAPVEDLSTAGYTQTYTKSSDLFGYGPNGYTFRARKISGYDDKTAPNRKSSFAPAVDNKFYMNQIDDLNPVTYAPGTVIGPVVSWFDIYNPN